MILSAGRLSAQKDFPTLIRAFATLRATREARLVILGGATADGKTEIRQQDLVALAEGLGVASDICLLGFMSNPYAYMARSKVFALSSAWEGFGNVLVEALACGCPVVSTDCPFGPAEILEGGRYGRLVQVGDDAPWRRPWRNCWQTGPTRPCCAGAARSSPSAAPWTAI